MVYAGVWFIIFFRNLTINNFGISQGASNRDYTHVGVQLRRPVVDKLHQWNENKKSSVQYDVKFIKLLLIDVFTSAVLVKSSINSLDQEKVKFVRG